MLEHFRTKSSHTKCDCSAVKSRRNAYMCFVDRKEGGIGIFGFAFLAIFSIGFSVLGPKYFGFSILVFIAVCGFFAF